MGHLVVGTACVCSRVECVLCVVSHIDVSQVYEVPEPGLAVCAALVRQHMETHLGGVSLPVRVYYGTRFGSLRPWRGEEAEQHAHASASHGGEKGVPTVSAGGSI